MITSAMQLKAKVRNLSHGDNQRAKALIRIFFMERLLERISLSKYKDQFVLKGGMLVSSLLGINFRATMDIDTTVKALPLTKNDIEKIIAEICKIPLDDHIAFKITGIETIMDEFDYPGIRVHIEGTMEKLRQPMKIDVSTDDAITPGAIEYMYPLLFEEREIRLNTYNVETLLAEKTQTILNRGPANTRMRDFYDLYEISERKEFAWDTYKNAFYATCRKRKTEFTKDKIKEVLALISSSMEMKDLWENYKKKNYYVEDIDYGEMMKRISETIIKMAES